jgi:hypothetical protein
MPQTDLDALLNGANSYPLAIIYGQATADSEGNINKGAVFGLLFIILCSGFMCVMGTVLTNSRTYWALARDNAVPLSGIFGQVNERLSCPVYSTLFVGTWRHQPNPRVRVDSNGKGDEPNPSCHSCRDDWHPRHPARKQRRLPRHHWLLHRPHYCLIR